MEGRRSGKADDVGVSASQHSWGGGKMKRMEGSEVPTGGRGGVGPKGEVKL